MAIKINHPTETLTPESGVLSVNSSGAFKLPSGEIIQRPAGQAGYIRFANDLGRPEFYDGTTWQLIADREYVENRFDTENNSVATVIQNLTLNDLADVTVTTPAAGQVLVYDAVLGQFRSQTNTLTPTTKRFTGDSVTSSFDLQTTVSSPNLLVVSVNGITQEPYYSYSVINGSILNFDEAPEQNDRIEVRILRSNTTSDRPRPKITNISYGQLGQFTTINIVATDITFGTGAKIGATAITRIDYPSESTLQLMIETSLVSNYIWNTSQDLTLVDTSGNEYTYKNLINYGVSRPYWTDSSAYIGTFSSGDSIDFKLGVNNYTSLKIDPAYAGEAAIAWISIVGDSIVGTTPDNSSPSRYEFTVTASNGNIDIVKNCWLLVI